MRINAVLVCLRRDPCIYLKAYPAFPAGPSGFWFQRDMYVWKMISGPQQVPHCIVHD
jgi:hypothetical protein